MEGKTVLITGCSSGIGSACAETFAGAGARLILNGRNGEALEALARRLSEEHGTVSRLMLADVRSREQVFAAVKDLPKEWCTIDVLINNAGGAWGLAKLHEAEVEDVETMIDTNVKGLFYLTRCVVPLMLERSRPGHVINVGSIAGIAAYPNGAVYCACKAAVKILSDGLRLDLVDKPVKVTNIQPGLVETNFSMVRFHGDAQRAATVYQGIIPLSAHDVADAVIYAAATPAHVQICEITLTPLHQSSATVVHRRS